MKYQSTNRHAPIVNAHEAVMNGLAPDGGLYVPRDVPKLPESFWLSLSDRSLQEIGFEIANAYLSEDVSEIILRDIISKTLSFEIPLVSLTERISILELFHGPTLAFKDVGARFTACLMGHFVERENREFTILVATSGATGSAVANGFYGV
ncbi:MAG: threonine synthase, partial [Patescibacteria group bacterium]